MATSLHTIPEMMFTVPGEVVYSFEHGRYVCIMQLCSQKYILKTQKLKC